MRAFVEKLSTVMYVKCDVTGFLRQALRESALKKKKINIFAAFAFF